MSYKLLNCQFCQNLQLPLQNRHTSEYSNQSRQNVVTDLMGHPVRVLLGRRLEAPLPPGQEYGARRLWGVSQVGTQATCPRQQMIH